MEYKGKLFGKIGNKYFQTGKTADDYDNIVKALEKAKSTISRLTLSMKVHPDCEENSEFADYVELGYDTIDEIDKVLTHNN